MVGNQIGILILDPFVSHNLCFKYSNGTCKPISNIYVSRFNGIMICSIQWFFTFIITLWRFGSPLGNQLLKWELHSLTPSYTPESMRCDSRNSFSAYIFTSPCLGREPMWQELLHTFTTKICTHNKNPVGSGTIM